MKGKFPIIFQTLTLVLLIVVLIISLTFPMPSQEFTFRSSFERLFIQDEENSFSLKEKNLGSKALVKLLDQCSALKESKRYICYQALAEEIALQNKSIIQDIMLHFFEKKNTGEIHSLDCHLFGHELGFFLDSYYGSEGVRKCPEKIDVCSWGCYHGMGENFHFRKFSLFENGHILNDEEFKRIQAGEDSFEKFNFHHGLGHSFYGPYQDIERALEKCDLTTTSYPSRVCYWGISHELFFSKAYQGVSIREAAKECKKFGEYEHDCYVTLGLDYADYDVNATIRVCEEMNNKGCVVGVGSFIHVSRNPLSVQSSINVCNSLVKNEELLPYCYEGIVLGAFYYRNNPSEALDVCLTITSGKKQCYAALEARYKASWLPRDQHFCDVVDQKRKCGEIFGLDG